MEYLLLIQHLLQTHSILSLLKIYETIPVDQAKSIIDSFNAQKLPLAWWVGPHSSHYKVDEVLFIYGFRAF